MYARPGYKALTRGVPLAQVPTEYFSGEGCLALPKLHLQFLTLHDYLLRNFNLFRLESTYEIRQDIEDAVSRMKPRRAEDGSCYFAGACVCVCVCVCVWCAHTYPLVHVCGVCVRAYPRVCVVCAWCTRIDVHMRVRGHIHTLCACATHLRMCYFV